MNFKKLLKKNKNKSQGYGLKNPKVMNFQSYGWKNKSQSYGWKKTSAKVWIEPYFSIEIRTTKILKVMDEKQISKLWMKEKKVICRSVSERAHA